MAILGKAWRGAGRGAAARATGALAVLAALAAGPGCGEPAAAPPEFGPQDAAPAGDAAWLAADVTSTGTMTGNWALATDWSTCVKVGAARFELRTYKLLTVKAVQYGHNVTEHRTLCSVVNTPLIGQVTVFPKALVSKMAPIDVASQIVGDQLGDAYQSGLDLQVFGVQLANLAVDPLPTSAADPRLDDTDGDGKPGGTLLIGTMCEAWVANRSSSTLHGAFVAPGRIEGGALQQAEQAVLGGTGAVCTQAFLTADNPTGNYFALQRVDGLGLDTDGNGDVSCDELVAGQAKFVTWRAADGARCAGAFP